MTMGRGRYDRRRSSKHRNPHYTPPEVLGPYHAEKGRTRSPDRADVCDAMRDMRELGLHAQVMSANGVKIAWMAPTLSVG